jgi:hypothetical protein
MRIGALTLFVSLCLPLAAQHRVDPRNMYERVLAIVPLVGSGTMSDPVRPAYAPLPGASAVTPSITTASGSTPTAALRPGIVAYSYLLSDDGKFALVEFVAVDRGAFKALLADTTITAFLKGRDSAADVLTEFQKYKKGFTLDQLRTVVP